MSDTPPQVIQYYAHHMLYAPGHQSDVFSFNPSLLCLKLYYEMYGNNNDVTWLLPRMVMNKTPDDIVNNLNTNTTIVGLSVYLWNEEYQYKIGKLIKEKYPHIKIVAGGPQVDIHKDNKYFIKHPYIDYAVFGDGEEAFQKIIDYESGCIPDRSSFVNTGVNNPDKEHNLELHEFKRLTDDDYFSKSFYLEQKEFLLSILEDFKKDLNLPNHRFALHNEYSRGCMYKCTFCDWTAGLHTKVKRTKKDWRAELDFFKELDVLVKPNDANFGQWDEDLEILRYVKEIHDPTKLFNIRLPNLTKLKKDKQIEINSILATLSDVPPTISLQDLDVGVLDAIDRPSLSWKDFLDIINAYREIRPNGEIRPSLILGLPSQTFESVIESIRLLTVEGKLYSDLFNNPLHFLPTSPQADPFYMKMYGLDFRKTLVFHPSKHKLIIPRESNIFSNLVDETKVRDPHFSKLDLIYKTKTLSREDIITINIISHIIENGHKKFDFNKNAMVEKVLYSSIPKARELAKIITENEETLYNKFGHVFQFSLEISKDGYLPHPNYIFNKNLVSLSADLINRYVSSV